MNSVWENEGGFPIWEHEKIVGMGNKQLLAIGEVKLDRAKLFAVHRLQ